MWNVISNWKKFVVNLDAKYRNFSINLSVIISNSKSRNNIRKRRKVFVKLVLFIHNLKKYIYSKLIWNNFDPFKNVDKYKPSISSLR